MRSYGVFDVLGPVMVGPSSSHTAGAARIGYMARGIVGEEISMVRFCMHGSFAKTYMGHGTDKALLAGILGLGPEDEDIKNAYFIAKKNNLEYEFCDIDLGDVHPNSVKLEITTRLGNKWEVVGCSIGGGKAKIIKIDDIDVEFDGEYTTLITNHEDCPGVVANVTTILSKYEVNIAFMKLYREQKSQKALMIIEADENIGENVVRKIEKIPHVSMCKVLKAI